MLQESAGRHAASLSISSDLLREKGMTWVLSRFHVRRSDKPLPGWKQVLTIQTWRAALERLFAIRDYRVLNSSGEVLAVATSHWAVLDTQARRIVGIPAFVKDSHPLTGERALDTSFSKLNSPARVDFQSKVQARLQHIDENAHVNNVNYLAWIMDSFPESVAAELELREFEILFRAECLLGDELICETERLSEKEFLHRIYKSGEQAKDVIQARTIWG